MKSRKFPQFLFVISGILIVLLMLDFYRLDFSTKNNLLEKSRYVFLAPNKKENFWSDIASGAKEADDVFGTDTLLVEYSENEKIRSYFMDAVLSQADGIIMKGTQYINEEIQEAVASGIPVVFYNSDFPESGRNCYIGVDNYKTGEKAAKLLAEELQKKGKILVIVRGKEASSQKERVRALEEELKQYPDMEIVEYIEDLGDALILKENLIKAMEIYTDLDAIICMEETASNHVGNLLTENHINPENYYIVSLDFTEQTMKYLEDDIYDSVVAYDTRQIGYLAVKFLEDYRKGEISTERDIIYLEDVVITKANMEEYQAGYERETLEWNSY